MGRTFMSLLICLAVLVFVNFNNVEALEAEGVIGGLPAASEEFKYVVSVQQQDYPICTGGIISERHILTAAHCVIESKNNTFKYGRFKIVAGTNDLNLKDLTTTIEVPVMKIYVPESYDSANWKIGIPKGDVAILELKNALDLEHNENLQKLELDNREPNNDDQYANVMAKFAGFGFDKVGIININGTKLRYGSSSRRLNKADVLLIDQPYCRGIFKEVQLYTLCAKVVNHEDGTPEGTCTGDSGGPLVVDGNVVVGTLSASTAVCNDNKKPSIFSKVATYVKLIESAKAGLSNGLRVNVANEEGVFL